MKTINLIAVFLTAIVLSACSGINDNRKIVKGLEQKDQFEFRDGRVIRLWVIDSIAYLGHGPNFKVSSFKLDGTSLREYGKLGEALWENGEIWGFFKTDGGYWLHDYSKQQLKYYAENDSMLFNKEVITRNNVFHLKDDVFVIPQTTDEEKRFNLTFLDLRKDSVLKKIDFDEVVPELKKTNAVGVGYLLSGNFGPEIKNGKLLYYTNYTGSAFLIDTANFSIERIDDFRDLEFPKSKNDFDMTILEPTRFSTIHAVLDDNLNTYFLTYKNFNKKIPENDFFIDMYNSEGIYQESYEVPRIDDDFPMTFSLQNDNVTVIYSNGKVVTFQIKNLG